MNGRRWVLSAGEYLVGRASRYLPPSTREQRHQEWSAELPVILEDPGVRPAARRAARMLWFAIDTLRGAAIARYTAAGRHAHRDADGKARDRLTREGLLGIVALPALLAVGGYFIYTAVSGPLLTNAVPFLVSFALVSLVLLASRRLRGIGSPWFAVSAVVMGTGLLLHNLSHRFGWGHALLFALIYYCSAVILIVSLCVIVVVWARAVQARRQRART
jgi:hypothetical protein